jgi:hypothetical protein
MLVPNRSQSGSILGERGAVEWGAAAFPLGVTVSHGEASLTGASAKYTACSCVRECSTGAQDKPVMHQIPPNDPKHTLTETCSKSSKPRHDPEWKAGFDVHTPGVGELVNSSHLLTTHSQ